MQRRKASTFSARERGREREGWGWRVGEVLQDKVSSWPSREGELSVGGR